MKMALGNKRMITGVKAPVSLRVLHAASVHVLSNERTALCLN